MVASAANIWRECFLKKPISSSCSVTFAISCVVTRGLKLLKDFENNYEN